MDRTVTPTRHATPTGGCPEQGFPAPVVHRLFAAGNSIALISKFMGHRTVQTTNTYYLRLTFNEILNQIHLPWSV